MPVSTYHHRRRVQFYETDLAGIVHFSWFFRYMEEAEHAMWREAGLHIAAPDGDLRFPRIATTCDFRAPLRFEDVVDVDLTIAAMTARTIRYECVIRKGDIIAGTGTMTTTCVRMSDASRAIALPPEVRATFAPLNQTALQD